MKNFFVPIDGGNTIGASSYFVNVDGNNILLDCGSRTSGVEKYPRFDKLYDCLNTPKEIDFVIISHAHFDHMGCLPYVSDMVSKSTVFLSTKTTKELSRLQLLEMNRVLGKNDSEMVRCEKQLKAENAINRIRDIPMMKKQKFKNAEITLIPAGHMLGAAMTYIQTKNHNILYTGDFSFETRSNINSIKLHSLKPDILIMNATHGYTCYEYTKDYSDLINEVNTNLQRGKNILLSSRSIPKLLDLFYLINESNISGYVYLSPETEIMADSFERIGNKVYSSKIQGYRKDRNKPHVLIGSADEFLGDYEEISVDKYSLHASYDELQRMIEILNPKKVFIVHTQPKDVSFNIVSDMKKNNMDIVQCFNEELYEF